MEKIVKELKTFFQRPGVQDIFELTYAYTIEGQHFFNRSLFASYVSCSTQTSPEELLTKTRKYLRADQSRLVHLQEQIGACQDRRAPIFHKMLTYTQKIRSLVRWAVPFEIQKRYPDRPDLSNSDHLLSLHEVQQLDYELFGHPIINDTWEVSRSDCYLSHALATYGDVLSPEEYACFQHVLTEIETLPAYNASLCKLALPVSLLDDDRFTCPVSREFYLQLFTLIFSFYGLQVPVVVDERSSIYDGHDALYFPSSEEYDSLPLGKVLELIAHEVEVHYIVLSNTDKVLYGIKGGRSLAREEGLAILHEYMLNGYALEDFDIRPNVPTLLVGELLDGTSYHEFFCVYHKLHGFIPRGVEYLLRRKRNYPFAQPGLLHKDVMYSRGMYHLRGRLLEYGAYEDLFLAKVDMEDMLCVAEHVHQEQLSVLFPKLLAMRLVWYILTGKTDTSGRIKKMKKKYRFISDVVLEPFTSHQQQIREEILVLISRICSLDKK